MDKKTTKVNTEVVDRKSRNAHSVLHTQLILGCKSGRVGYVQKMINLCDPSGEDNLAIQMASSGGHFDVVKLLLSDLRVDPSANDNYAIVSASINGHARVVRILLEHKKVDPSSRNNYPIRAASQNNHLEVIKELLNDKRVDPSDVDDEALGYACSGGNLEAALMLRTDLRVNPASKSNYAIRACARKGHVSIVKYLLQDERVDPSDSENEALRKASENGYVDVVKVLLNDERVDPASSDYEAIRLAAEKGHTEIAELLLSDSRTNLDEVLSSAENSSTTIKTVFLKFISKKVVRRGKLLFQTSKNEEEEEEEELQPTLEDTSSLSNDNQEQLGGRSSNLDFVKGGRTIKVDPTALEMVEKIICDDKDPRNWITLCYTSPTDLTVTGSGTGGIEQSKKLFLDDLRSFCVLRGTHIIKGKSFHLVPFVVIFIWIPLSILPFEQSQAMYDVEELCRFLCLKRFSVVKASKKSEVTSSYIASELILFRGKSLQGRYILDKKPNLEDLERILLQTSKGGFNETNNYVKLNVMFSETELPNINAPYWMSNVDNSRLGQLMRELQIRGKSFGELIAFRTVTIVSNNRKMKLSLLTQMEQTIEWKYNAEFYVFKKTILVVPHSIYQSSSSKKFSSHTYASSTPSKTKGKNLSIFRKSASKSRNRRISSGGGGLEVIQEEEEEEDQKLRILFELDLRHPDSRCYRHLTIPGIVGLKKGGDDGEKLTLKFESEECGNIVYLIQFLLSELRGHRVMLGIDHTLVFFKSWLKKESEDKSLLKNKKKQRKNRDDVFVEVRSDFQMIVFNNDNLRTRQRIERHSLVGGCYYGLIKKQEPNHNNNISGFFVARPSKIKYVDFGAIQEKICSFTSDSTELINNWTKVFKMMGLIKTTEEVGHNNDDVFSDWDSWSDKKNTKLEQTTQDKKNNEILNDEDEDGEKEEKELEEVEGEEEEEEGIFDDYDEYLSQIREKVDNIQDEIEGIFPTFVESNYPVMKQRSSTPTDNEVPVEKRRNKKGRNISSVLSKLEKQVTRKVKDFVEEKKRTNNSFEKWGKNDKKAPYLVWNELDSDEGDLLGLIGFPLDVVVKGDGEKEKTEIEGAFRNIKLYVDFKIDEWMIRNGKSAEWSSHNQKDVKTEDPNFFTSSEQLSENCDENVRKIILLKNERIKELSEELKKTKTEYLLANNNSRISEFLKTVEEDLENRRDPSKSFHELGIVGANQRIDDKVFFSRGGDRHLSFSQRFLFLMSNNNIGRENPFFETVLYHREKDERIDKFLEECTTKLSERYEKLKTLENLFKFKKEQQQQQSTSKKKNEHTNLEKRKIIDQFKRFVSEVMKCVSDFYGGLSIDNKKYLEKNLHEKIRFIHKETGKNVVMLGEAEGMGLCRYRAILFKILSDLLGLKCCLIRGDKSMGKKSSDNGKKIYHPHVWNIVFFKNYRAYIVDCMRPLMEPFDDDALIQDVNGEIRGFDVYKAKIMEEMRRRKTTFAESSSQQYQLFVSHFEGYDTFLSDQQTNFSSTFGLEPISNLKFGICGKWRMKKESQFKVEENNLELERRNLVVKVTTTTSTTKDGENNVISSSEDDDSNILEEMKLLNNVIFHPSFSRCLCSFQQPLDRNSNNQRTMVRFTIFEELGNCGGEEFLKLMRRLEMFPLVRATEILIVLMNVSRAILHLHDSGYVFVNFSWNNVSIRWNKEHFEVEDVKIKDLEMAKSKGVGFFRESDFDRLFEHNLEEEEEGNNMVIADFVAPEIRHLMKEKVKSMAKGENKVNNTSDVMSICTEEHQKKFFFKFDESLDCFSFGKFIEPFLPFLESFDERIVKLHEALVEKIPKKRIKMIDCVGIVTSILRQMDRYIKTEFSRSHHFVGGDNKV